MEMLQLNNGQNYIKTVLLETKLCTFNMKYIYDLKFFPVKIKKKIALYKACILARLMLADPKFLSRG